MFPDDEIASGDRVLGGELVTRFRSFLNGDPPDVIRLCQIAGLGRGFAHPGFSEHFDNAVFSLSHFDRHGLIVAEDDDGTIVGFAHAGFGFDATGNQLDHSVGVICFVTVAPEYRRQGIGRELIERCEEYLRSRGAKTIQAGETRSCDPFYFGLYGGARPTGFLQSDPLAETFFHAIGYSARDSVAVMHRDLTSGNLPTSMKLMEVKRDVVVNVNETPTKKSRWWFTHPGWMDPVQLELIHRRSGEPVASLAMTQLHQYNAAWGSDAIGIVDVNVPEEHRNKGYAHTLIIETLRLARTEAKTVAECHIPNDNEAALATANSVGFEQVDMGVIYARRA